MISNLYSVTSNDDGMITKLKDDLCNELKYAWCILLAVLDK